MYTEIAQNDDLSTVFKSFDRLNYDHKIHPSFLSFGEALTQILTWITTDLEKDYHPKKNESMEDYVNSLYSGDVKHNCLTRQEIIFLQTIYVKKRLPSMENVTEILIDLITWYMPFASQSRLGGSVTTYLRKGFNLNSDYLAYEAYKVASSLGCERAIHVYHFCLKMKDLFRKRWKNENFFNETQSDHTFWSGNYELKSVLEFVNPSDL